MDAWESTILLEGRQLESITAWKKQSDENPLPLKFEEEHIAPSSRPGTPLRALKQREGSIRPSSRPGTPVLNATVNARGRHSLHPVNPIHTPQQFHDWFALIERSIQHSQESHFRTHLSQLTSHLDKFQDLNETLDRVDGQVIQMLSAWKSVEDGGRSLQEASEQLVEEKNRLVQVTDAISARLAYFQELERATRMLNHPGDDLVLQPDFLIMVERVDICLEFLQSHRNYREADIYILRFQQCLIRAMSLIKIFFTASIRTLSSEVERHLAEKTTSTLSITHSLYSKFASLATQMAPLLSEFERRAIIHPSDLQSLLDECQATYLATRKTLLTPRILTEVKGLDPAHSEIVELTRTGCGYLRQLCEDEFTLYRRFFSSGEERLYRYLETLCDFLYDDLRPRILHEQRINVLCEVCTVLQALMVIGNDIQGDEEDDAEERESVVPETPKEVTDSSRMQKLHIAPLLQMILQDAQTRLVFKAQAIVQSDVRLHVPTEDDLRYPEKLIQYRTARAERQKARAGAEEDAQSDDDQETIEQRRSWYPSVGKAAWIMGMLQEFVKPAIFRDIAQEAIAFSREALEVASQRIAAKDTPSAKVDAKLFLIHHLLILKDLTTEVDFNAGKPDTEQLPSTSEGIFGIPLFRPVALLGGLASLGVPKLLSGAETPLNIDQELKLVCERLISDCVSAATLPVRTFVQRSSAYLNTFTTAPLNEKSDLLSQDFATPEQALETNREFKRVCEQEVRTWISRVRLFLDDERTVSALVSPLQHQIVEEYALFRGLLTGRYGQELLLETYTEMGLMNELRQWLA